MEVEELMRALHTTAAKVAIAYYVVAATCLYGLFGRLSSPNPRLKTVSLDAGSSVVAEEEEAVGGGGGDGGKQQQQQSSSSSSGAPLKRKLVRALLCGGW